jgi:D-alanyl-D-alanine carboxypeptidase/D-alanyl-D-alanine-endopeptidase (penicillin-binding protein 4)
MKFFIFLSFFLISHKSFSGIKEDINAILRTHHFKEKNLGLVISNEGKTIYELNSKKLMIPASLTKIFTAGTVLTSIPLNTKFTTEVWSAGKIKNKVLKGNICLKGGGDPSFVSEKMWFLVNELTRSDFSKIDGDILIDTSKFDSELFDIGRDSNRVDRAFDAPVSAISFNWNSVNVFVRPGDNVDDPAKVFVDPMNDYIEVENKTKTGKEGSNKTIEILRVKVSDHDKIIVTGKIPLGGPEHVAYKSITNPALWSGKHFKEFLSQRKIEVTGKVKEASCETESTKMASVDSKYLIEMVADMLKFSNNFVAEMLIKNLASVKSPSTPAKMKDGVEEIRTFLDSLEIKKDSYNLENVSGLTRDNKFTAEQILKTLLFLKSDFKIFPEFLSGLPIAGVDGTMKSRMKNSKEDAVVRAKTGYLDGVVGLAGFVGRKDKSPITFVFMFNGSYEEGLASRKLFDDIIERVKKWD